MTHLSNERIDTTRHQPPADDFDLDAFLIDDEFDDFLDRHVAGIRESLNDFRNL